MRKKVLTALLCAALALTAFGCYSEIPEHEHDYGGVWVLDTPATCTEDGRQTRTCKICGYEDSQTVPATGHSFGARVKTVMQTCSTPGIYERTCKTCGYIEREETPYAPHYYGEWTYETHPNCLHGGERSRQCLTCDRRERETLNATAHTFGDWQTVTEATCLHEGERIRTCTVCRKSETEVLPVSGHRYQALAAVAPTDTSFGLDRTAACTDCGYTPIGRKKLLPLSAIPAAFDYRTEDGEEISYALTFTNDGAFVLTALTTRPETSRYEQSFSFGTAEQTTENVLRLTDDGGNVTYVRMRAAQSFTLCDENGIEAGNITVRRSGTPLAQTPVGNSRYGYNDFSLRDKGEESRKLYTALAALCDAFSVSTQDLPANDGDEYVVLACVPIAPYGLTPEEAIKVWKVFFMDNPSYYWLHNSLSYPDSALELRVSSAYATASARQSADAAIASMASDCAVQTQSAVEPLDRAAAIHDYLIRRMQYGNAQDYVADEHSLAGAARGTGVCEAYAKAYAYLCLRAGVDCVLAAGTLNDVPHAWNVIRVSYGAYAVDVTSDDGASTPRHLFFAMTDAETEQFGYLAQTPQGEDADYLYDLPALNADPLTCVRLYRNGQNCGVYGSIDLAFAAMYDAQASYRLQLFNYHYDIVIVKKHAVSTAQTPEAKQIEFVGPTTAFGSDDKGAYFLTVTSVPDGFTLHSDLVLCNISLYTQDGLPGRECNLNGHTLTTIGRSCTLYPGVTDTGNGKIVIQTETDFYGRVHVQTLTQTEASASFFADAHIQTWETGGFRTYNGAQLTVDVLRIDDGWAVCYIGKNCALTVRALQAQPDGFVHFDLEFTEPSNFPALRLTETVSCPVTIALDGHEVTHIGSIDGSEIYETVEKNCNAFLLETPIAYVPKDMPASLLTVAHVIWQETGGGTHADYTKLYRISGDGAVTLNADEIADDGMIFKDGAFAGMDREAAALTVPNGTVAIDDEALAYNKSIASLYIPKSVTHIGENAFAHCSSLTITYEGTVAEWNALYTVHYDYQRVRVVCSDGVIEA